LYIAPRIGAQWRDTVTASGTELRILLIEDSEIDAALTLRALRTLAPPFGPADVVRAPSWAEAAPHLAAADLILLDFNLPGRSGLEILESLTGRPHPPVIMLTGQHDIATAVATLRAGAADYLVKTPDAGPALCLTIERVLDRVRLERELDEAQRQLAEHALDLECQVEARTKLVQAQGAEIEELYLKAEAAARLKAEILRNVSHELRTPLSVILGNADVLAELMNDGWSPEDVARAHDTLTALRRRAEHLRQLVESLLALVRLEAGADGVTVSSFSLSRLMEQVRAAAEALDPSERVTMTWDLPPAPCDVEHDREKIRIIASHLVSNALKFTPEGSVRLTAVRREDGGIVLTVADTGIGLPPEARGVVFDDFRQVDGSTTRRYGGLGLGLGIVRRYSELLHGTLDLDSEQGKGTVVTLALPPPTVDADDEPADDRGGREAAGPPGAVP
jgi:signal transduction histidine kinase